MPEVPQFLIIQKPVRVEGSDITIGEYLSWALGHIFEIDKEANTLYSKFSLKIIVNGLDIEDNVSLGWLVLNMSSIDNFLYVTIILK